MKLIKNVIIISSIVFSAMAETNISIPYKDETNHTHLYNALKVISKFEDNKGLSQKIIEVSQKYKIEPEIIVSIINVESQFNQKAISSTGDLSIAQINLKVWNKELKRLKIERIDKNKLKKDYKYSLDKMGLILSLLKKRHSSDKEWYGTYHSTNAYFKKTYVNKVNIAANILKNALFKEKHKYLYTKELY